MTVGDLLTADVLTAGAADTLRQAARRMHAASVGSVVVVEKGRLVGILTERDVLRAVAVGDDLDATPVSQHMTTDVVTVGPDWEVYEAAAEMGDRRIRHLVVTEGDDVVGMLSVRDVLLAGQRVSLGGGEWAVLRDPLTFSVRERRRLQKALLGLPPGPAAEIDVDDLIGEMVGSWSFGLPLPASPEVLGTLPAPDLDVLRAAVRDDLPQLQRAVHPAPGWRRWG